jgi:hypothetical protein
MVCMYRTHSVDAGVNLAPVARECLQELAQNFEGC